LYDPSGIIGGKTEIALAWLVLIVIGLVTFAAGITLFRKRDLPL